MLSGSWKARLLAAAVFCSSAGSAAWAQVAPPDPKPGMNLLADALTDDARLRARSLPLALGGPQAMILLQMSQKLNPDNPQTLRFLAIAATNSKDMETARETLKNEIRLDPTNLVAVVDYLDLLAQGKPVDEQIRIFTAATARDTLDPQVRSEAAVRLGRLMVQRGDLEEAAKDFQLAIKFNDVNVGALQEVCALLAKDNAKPVDRMRAFVNLLYANPYQPEALLAGATLLASNNAHSLAADWLVTAQEQIPLAGFDVPKDLYFILANELLCANRLSEAQGLVEQMLRDPDAPPAIGMLGALLEKGGRVVKIAPPAPPSPKGSAAGAPAPVTATAPAGDVPATLEQFILQKTGANLVAHPRESAALDEWLWSQVYFAKELAADFQKNLDVYKEVVGAGNPAYQRFVGWELLRQNDVDQAKGVLTPVAAADSYAMLGLARAAELQNDKKTEGTLLLRIWDTSPSGLLASTLSAEARRLGLTLAQSKDSLALVDAAKKYPDSMLTIHRHPRDLVLVQPRMTKGSYDVGEPIMLNVSMLNSTDRALYAGPGGAVSNSIAMGGNIRGVNPMPLGVFSIENAPRVFRLDARGTLTIPLRVDQGLVRDIFYGNPSRLFNLGLFVMTSPRPTTDGGVLTGPGGQSVSAGEFSRTGFSFGGNDGLVHLSNDLPTMTVDHQMVLGGVLESFVYNLPEDQTAAPGGVTSAEARKRVIDALVHQLQTAHPVVQAWMVRYCPFKEVPSQILDAVDKMADNPDPVVRLYSCARVLQGAGKEMTARSKAASELRKRAEKETDPLVKRWAELLVKESGVNPEEKTQNVPAGTVIQTPTTAPSLK